MITLVIRIKIKDGTQEEFESAAAEQVSRVRRSEPGSVLYTLVRSQSDPTEYVFLEAYRDDAALATHIEDFQKFWGPIMNRLIARPNAVERLDSVAGLARDVDWPRS